MDEPDVAVHYVGASWGFMGLYQSLCYNLQSAGFQLSEGLQRGRCSGKVQVVLFESRFPDERFGSLVDRIMESGKPVIPVKLRCMSYVLALLLRRRFGWGSRKDPFYQLRSITAHELARCDGGEHELKLRVLVDVSRLVRVPLLEEAKELKSQAQVYNKRISDLKEESIVAVILFVKVLAGEFVTQAGFPRLCGTSSHKSQSSKIEERVKKFAGQSSGVESEVSTFNAVAESLSIQPLELARRFDACRNARNEAAHFFHDKDWRKHLFKARDWIKKYPELEKEIPNQVFILRNFRKLCRGLGVGMKFTNSKC